MTERERFENWARRSDANPLLNRAEHDGKKLDEYHFPLARAMWEAWQAARAASPKVPQCVEEWMNSTPNLVRGERFYSESDIRAYLSGMAIVPVEVIAHYDALPFLIEPIKAAKRKGMTSEEACRALSAWDKARNTVSAK